MFVLESGGDNRELKAPHVPGEDEHFLHLLGFLIKRPKRPMSCLSLYLGSVLDLQEFNAQALFSLLVLVCHMINLHMKQ